MHAVFPFYKSLLLTFLWFGSFGVWSVSEATAATSTADNARVRYDNNWIVTIIISSADQVRALQKAIPKLDVWSPDRLRVGVNEVRVNPQAGDLNMLDALNISVTDVKTTNLQEILDDEMASYQKRKLEPLQYLSLSWIGSFHTWEEKVAFYKQLATTYSAFVTYVPSIGKTIEGRDIFMLVIRDPSYTPTGILWLQTLQHAREWLAGAAADVFTYELLRDISEGAPVATYLRSVKICIVPVANPDGYVYSWTTDRMWRKNRRGGCGVDLNRNYNFDWSVDAGDGSSNWNAETYYGSAPFSEPESTATSQQFLLQTNSTLKSIAVDIHTYGQWLYRAVTTANTPGHIVPDVQASAMKSWGASMSSLIFQKSGVTYTSTPTEYLGGAADDWYFFKGGAYGSYTFELRDTGAYGFVAPADAIIPTGEEIYECIKFLIAQVDSVSTPAVEPSPSPIVDLPPIVVRPNGVRGSYQASLWFVLLLLLPPLMMFH